MRWNSARSLGDPHELGWWGWLAGAARSEPEVALAADEVDRHALRLVTISRRGDSELALHRFAELPRLLGAGDLVVVNDAATLPASLVGVTAQGEPFELRLTAPVDGGCVDGVLFDDGDWRTRTEHRGPPPAVAVGDRVMIEGKLAARVVAVTGRRVRLAADGGAEVWWSAIYERGKAVQYAHRRDELPLWAVQTAYAGRPWAVEMPSAGRGLTWEVLLGLRDAGIRVATLTHAAGLGATGDAALDRALPLPERYEVPQSTADAIAESHRAGGRVIAIGTSVVRALEASGGRAGAGVATLRLDRTYELRVVDGLVSGRHVPGESHFEMLEAFAPAERLRQALQLAARAGLSGHELGDACLIA